MTIEDDLFQATADTFAKCASDMISKKLFDACNESIRVNIVPTFEKLTRTLFTQMNDTFYKGVQQCKL